MKHYTLLLLIVTLTAASPACKEKRGELKRIWFSGSYNRDFNDLNERHLQAATAIGIQPVASRDQAESASRKTVEVETNNHYEVETLTHSLPYLVPEAERLLDEIGRNFQDTLAHRNAPLYKIKVTSILRTADDVKNLGKRNTNASENSAHLYGTTFDISWVRYTKIDPDDPVDISNDDLKMALAMVLRDLKRAGRCYVKHERKQGCFHITARGDV